MAQFLKLEDDFPVYVNLREVLRVIDQIKYIRKEGKAELIVVAFMDGSELIFRKEYYEEIIETLRDLQENIQKFSKFVLDSNNFLRYLCEEKILKSY